jgi:hypothetical protein
VDLLLPLDGETPAPPAGPKRAVSPVDIDVGAAPRALGHPPAMTVRELDSRSAFIEFADTPLRSTGSTRWR